MSEQLANRDYVIVIDRSGSMATADCNGKSRWAAAAESTAAIANKVAQYDPDGISLYLFNNSFKRFDNTTADKVSQIFGEYEPMGGTALVPVLTDIFNDYTKRKTAGQTKANGQIVLVVTDGQPDDQTATAQLISGFTQKLENGDGEFGISFIQVGKDSAASSFLKKLDDDLTGQYKAKFDIVDTLTMDEVADRPLNEVLLSALTD